MQLIITNFQLTIWCKTDIDLNDAKKRIMPRNKIIQNI